MSHRITFIHESFADVDASPIALEWLHSQPANDDLENPLAELYVLAGLEFATRFFNDGGMAHSTLREVATNTSRFIESHDIYVLATAAGGNTNESPRMPTASPVPMDSGKLAVGLLVPRECIDDMLATDDMGRRVEALAGVIHAASLAEFMVLYERHAAKTLDSLIHSASFTHTRISAEDYILAETECLPRQMENRAVELASMVLLAAYKQTKNGYREGLTGYPKNRFVPRGDPYRMWLYSSLR